MNIPRTILYCASAVAITLAMSGSVFAQGMAMKKMPAMPTAAQTTQKIIAENAKLQVVDGVTRPGETSPMQLREGSVYHYVTGGTFERTFADGKKDVVTRKTGETVLITEKRQYSAKNIGKTVAHAIVVKLK